MNAGNEEATIQNSAPIEERASFDFVRYANCWEDADILIEALQPGPNDRILSIASAGDNALALLAKGAEVVAADISPAQLALVELKCAAFRELSYTELLEFLGVQPADNRLELYQRVEPLLSDETCRYFDKLSDKLAGGIIHAGKFESYFHLFRTKALPWIHRKKTVESLFEPRDKTARIAFWNRHWNNFRWRLLLRTFFSRFVMGRLGRDPEFFRFVEGTIYRQIQDRAFAALTELQPEQSPFLQYIATGNFRTALPRYLRPEFYDSIRANLDRLILHQGPIETAAEAHGEKGFDGMNLSDIFEYLSEDAAHGLYERLISSANPGARIVYWNAFVPRRCPDMLKQSGVVAPLDEVAADLRCKDHGFFYSDLRVETLVADPSSSPSSR